MSSRAHRLVLGLYLTGLALSVGAILWLNGGRFSSRRRRWGLAGLVLVALGVSGNQVRATLTTPLSAANIYATNFQSRRLAVEFWDDRVAVTDVGRVALSNPHYVLDLWGTGSETARRWRRDSPGTEWADRLAAARFRIRSQGVSAGLLGEQARIDAGDDPQRVAVVELPQNVVR